MPGTVTVASKLPFPLVLRVYTMEDAEDGTPGGGTRVIKKARPAGEAVTINGWSHPIGAAEPPEYAIIGGFALTPNVDADFFQHWLAQNRDHDAVRNNLIFAHAKDTAGVARERKGLKSGLERVDPERPGEGLTPYASVTTAG